MKGMVEGVREGGGEEERSGRLQRRGVGGFEKRRVGGGARRMVGGFELSWKGFRGCILVGFQ